ncbi:MAG TPA: leishmanolysin-related zinc metalloendopeptidase [Gemmatimonadales bacterium]|nr:leishmanolysin-related zinc metalloendopeptidase [Gemmatimonadales bacterium]
MLLAVVACGGDGRTGPAVDIAEISVEPDAVVLNDVGQSRQLTVAVLDGAGDSVANPSLEWRSSNPQVVSVNASGLVVAQAGGTARVTASSGTVSDTTMVSVRAFDIVLTYVTQVTSAQRAAFEAARNRWESIILGDLPPVNQNLDANECGANPATSGPFDDVTIFVEVKTIDGPDGTLGQAGPCFIRVPGDLTVIGRMEFDVDDMEIIADEGLLEEVVLHEMGHVLGFGTLWGPESFDLLRNPSEPDSLRDTHFVGQQALAAFNAAGGGSYSGEKVPVMNEGGAGTLNSHWRDAVFGPELMTGFINVGANPLSAISVAAMQDITYTVSTEPADPYTLNPGIRIAGPRRGRQMVNDVIKDPIRRIDLNGRIVGTIRR